MFTSAITLVKAKTQPRQLERVDLESKQIAFLQGVIEGLGDGILILNEQGNLIYANEYAKQICNQLHQGDAKPDFVPQQIWKTCLILIENRNLFPGKSIVFSDEIIAGNSDAFSIQVQLLYLSQFTSSCLLVTIENQRHCLETAAIAEAQLYGLTPGETKVWLLYRANYTYKQIASKLYITINTVKKHMKNIHAKRQETLAGNNE